jgi:outer membrane protein insertion porin family
MPHPTRLQNRYCLLQTLIVFAMLAFLPQDSLTQQSPAAKQAAETAPETAQILPSYEGQNVSTVELAGRPDLDPAPLTPLVAQREGEPFSRAKIEATIAALQSTGRFRNVQLQVLPESSGVRVLFVLEPAVYFGVYEFPGAFGRFSYSRLLQASNYPPQAGPFSSYDVQRAQAALTRFFQRAGYFEVQVRPEVQTDTAHGLANVFFNVTLNRRAQFGKVAITGTTPQESRRLRDSIESFWARLGGAAIREGKTYKLKTVQNALQYLQDALAKQDYLGAQVKLMGANYDPETNRADVSFNVKTGPVIHVKVVGAHLWPWTRKKLIPLFQQAGFNPELIQEGRQNLISHFQSKGYFEARVNTMVQELPAGESVVYEIAKGSRHKVTSVRIAGNRHFPDKELMQHVTVKKAAFLAHGNYSEKLVHLSVINLTNIYKASGFSAVKVTPQVSKREGNIGVVFQIEEGQQDLVEALRIEGNRTLSPAQFAPKGLKVVPGQPYSQKLVNEDRKQIVANYLNRGYLTATFHATATPLPNDKHRLSVEYQISEGPQVHTADVITAGRNRTNQKVINRASNLRKGEPLREDQLLASESRLYNVGVFDWAQIDPRRQITTQTQEDVVIKVHESKRNSIIYGGGFEVINRGGSVPGGTVAVPGLPPVGLPASFKTSEKTFYGPRGTFEYTRKNLRGKAESLTVSGLAGRLLQRGSAGYTDPSFRWTDWSSNLTLSGEHNSENPIFTSRLAQLGLQFQRPLNPGKTTNFFLRYNFSVTGLTRLLIPELVPPSDQHVRLSTASVAFVRDTRDKPLDAHKGIYETLDLAFNPAALGSNFSFAKLLGQVAYYRNIGAGVIWANSLRLGFETPFGSSHVPLSELFFSGGGGTLRGFPLNGAGPQRALPACGDPTSASTCSFITVPVGGRQLFILNSEFRVPHLFQPVPLPFGVNKHLGAVAFYDGGNVFPAIGFHGQYTNSIGGGLRYETPVGPVRIDIGHNLNAAPGIKATQIFVTLGQAF